MIAFPSNLLYFFKPRHYLKVIVLNIFQDGLHFLELLYRQLVPDPGRTITLKLNVAGKDQVSIADAVFAHVNNIVDLLCPRS